MSYSIGEFSTKVNISVDTLRYYDKEGLMPFIERNSSGRRVFKDADLNYVEVIKCLKRSNVSIKEIRTFIEWCMEGDSTLFLRKNFFDEQELALEKQIADLESALAFLKWKKWYYQQAYQAGTETIHFISGTNEVDPNVKKKYESNHSLSLS
ncbi:MerR family transcriptional regulator [Enterococcus sp. LJL99]